MSQRENRLKLELFDVLVLEQFYVLCFKSYIIKMLEFFSPLIFVAWLFCLPSSSLGPSLTWCPKTELLVLSPLPTSGLWLRQPPRRYAEFASRNLFIFSVWSVFDMNEKLWRQTELGFNPTSNRVTQANYFISLCLWWGLQELICTWEMLITLPGGYGRTLKH